MSVVIKDIDSVKSIIDKYEWLIKESERFIEDECFDSIYNLECSDDNLTIYYSTYYLGTTDYLSETIPIAWLFMNDKELEKVKKELEKVKKELETKQKQENLDETIKQMKRKLYEDLADEFER